ncbi:hypothetical protein GLYMA_02G048666v4 [Glycine max]|nr:hypothetical protein GLYMA_02G048666v4 [Glycine max]KAH1060349.1 hypothetical protein GYH30_004029 [Glycine max]
MDQQLLRLLQLVLLLVHQLNHLKAQLFLLLQTFPQVQDLKLCHQ